MEIRRYNPGEEPEIWAVFYGSTRNIVAREYTPEQVRRWAPDGHDMGSWSAKISRTNPFVALVDGRIVGFAELEPDGHIDCFYCHHEFQRRGIGTALMRAVLEEAERLGLDRLFAEVSTTGREFFISSGFEVDETTDSVVCGRPARQYRMSRERG